MPDARQLGIVLKPSGQHAFGDDFDPGVTADSSLVACLVPDDLADLGSQENRHSLGSGSGGQSPWLEHHDAAAEPWLLDQPQRCDGGLAGAGWCDQQRRATAFQGRRQVGQHIDNGSSRAAAGSATCQPRAGVPWNGPGSPATGMFGLIHAVTVAICSATSRHSAAFHPSAQACSVPSSG